MVKILNSQFNVFYPSNPIIRRRVFDLEDKLKDQFQTPFNTLPIPDDAPPDIPRIAALSRNGHSQLNISLNCASLVTTYDDNFSSKWHECMSYIERRVNNYIPIIEELSGGYFLFSGFVVTARIAMRDDPVGFLIDKFIKLNASPDPFDVQVKFTFVKDSSYYVNVTFSNIRNYEGMASPDAPMPTYPNLKSEDILLVLDVNDRYGYNNERVYKSARVNRERLFALVTEVLTERLGEIIEKGEFHI